MDQFTCNFHVPSCKKIKWVKKFNYLQIKLYTWHIFVDPDYPDVDHCHFGSCMSWHHQHLHQKNIGHTPEAPGSDNHRCIVWPTRNLHLLYSWKSMYFSLCFQWDLYWPWSSWNWGSNPHVTELKSQIIAALWSLNIHYMCRKINIIYLVFKLGKKTHYVLLNWPHKLLEGKAHLGLSHWKNQWDSCPALLLRWLPWVPQQYQWGSHWELQFSQCAWQLMQKL